MLALLPAVKRITADPKTWRRFHLVMTFVWAGLAYPSVTVWRESIPYLVFISVYAIIVGHVSAWQGSRAEDQATDCSDLR